MSYVYLLFCDNGRRTYIGATNDVDRRLRQHNRELSGGAQSTHGKSWTRACYMGGFPDWKAALQFEWMWKWKSRNYRGLLGKLTGLCELLQSGKSSSGSLPYCLWQKPPELYIDLVEKIELFDGVKSVLGRLQFPHSKMSSVSSSDISDLTVIVQLLRDEVMSLRARMEELMAAQVVTAHESATKEPKLIKKTATPKNTVEDSSATEAPAKAKRTRRTKEEIMAEKAEKEAKKAERDAKKAAKMAEKPTAPAVPTEAAAPAPAAPAKAKRGRKPKAAALVAEAGDHAPAESETAPAESETAPSGSPLL